MFMSPSRVRELIWAAAHTNIHLKIWQEVKPKTNLIKSESFEID